MREKLSQIIREKRFVVGFFGFFSFGRVIEFWKPLFRKIRGKCQQTQKAM
jgi:hypothetical protein